MTNQNWWDRETAGSGSLALQVDLEPATWPRVRMQAVGSSKLLLSVLILLPMEFVLYKEKMAIL